MSYVSLSVLTLQQGLSVAGVPPGVVDGRWGPQTHEAMRAWTAEVAPTMGLDSARVLAPLREYAVGASVVQLEARIAGALEELAASYRAPPLARRPPPVSVVQVPSSGNAGWMTVLGVVVGAGIVGGLSYWLWGRS